MGRVGRAGVLEQVLFEVFERHRAQKTRRHDAVGVEVVAAQRQRAARDGGDRGHVVGLCSAYALTSSIMVLTSTTSPAIAAAATMAGLMSSVRPVGLPCRPLKLRFED